MVNCFGYLVALLCLLIYAVGVLAIFVPDEYHKFWEFFNGVNQKGD